MPKIMDIDFSIQMSCKLLNASIFIDTCDVPNKMVVTAENEDLRFALEFIDDSLLRLKNIPEKMPAENAVMYFEIVSSLTVPLNELKRRIHCVLDASDLNERDLSLRDLLLETTKIEADVDKRIDRIKKVQPELFIRRRPGCSGFISAKDVLVHNQTARKSEKEKARKQKA